MRVIATLGIIMNLSALVWGYPHVSSLAYVGLIGGSVAMLISFIVLPLLEKSNRNAR